MICQKTVDLYQRKIWFRAAVYIVWFLYLVAQVMYTVYLVIYTCVLGYKLTDADNKTVACIMIPGIVIHIAYSILHTVASNNERERRIKQYEVPPTNEAGIEENDDIVIGVTESNKQQYVIIVNP